MVMAIGSFRYLFSLGLFEVRGDIELTPINDSPPDESHGEDDTEHETTTPSSLPDLIQPELFQPEATEVDAIPSIDTTTISGIGLSIIQQRMVELQINYQSDGRYMIIQLPDGDIKGESIKDGTEMVFSTEAVKILHDR